MKILVIGGTGFLGTRLVKKLLSLNNDVTVCSRKKSKVLGMLGAKERTCNLTDEKSVETALRDTDIVYHLAANLDESDPSMLKTNILITENIIRACQKKNIKRIIFTSSIGVLGYTKEPATEDMPYNPSTLYEKSKTECEKLIKSSGLPYTIARLTIICGPNRFWSQIFCAAEKGYPVIGSGKNYWHLLYIDDAVDSLILMLNQAAKNNTYHIASGDPHTYLDTYRTIAKALNTPEPRKHIPVIIAKAAALLHETTCRLRKKRPDITKMVSSIERLTRNRLVSIEKAQKELGYSPRYDLETSIKKTRDALI